MRRCDFAFESSSFTSSSSQSCTTVEEEEEKKRTWADRSDAGEAETEPGGRLDALVRRRRDKSRFV